MGVEQRLRLPRLKQAVDRIGGRVVRAVCLPEALRVADPAGARFDCPPDDAGWEAYDPASGWGGRGQWTWFAGEFNVPDDWPGGQIELRIVPAPNFLDWPKDDNFAAGPEGQAFVDGGRVGAIDGGHQRIAHPFKPGKRHTVRAVFFAGRCDNRHRMEHFDLVRVDRATRELWYDLRVALELAERVDDSSVGREKLLRAVEAAVAPLDFRSIEHQLVADDVKRDPACASFYASVGAARQAFDKARARWVDAGDLPTIVALGHAHIDLAWLWPFEHTRHKIVRTFATQCRLLDEYEGWRFNQSSPQAYAWLAEDAPELFQRVLGWIKAGRWEAEGATWVEMDTNVPGGESLVRQFLYGKRYFRDELGVDSKVLWLPDVFGYSAALPQLMRLAGVEGFVTSKISWSQFNRFPHDTFRWRGLDGSEMPTHFITTPDPANGNMTYNASLSVGEVIETWRAYRQKPELGEPLSTFGLGDGGGGPTESMLQFGRRLADWPLPGGAARVAWDSAAELMQRVAGRADELPVWDGELYLEYHRGTYTTQAWLKRANRRNEGALHDVEWLATLAGRLGVEVDAAAWDADAVAALWRDLLLCQFHDILPGSSVSEVYDEVRPMQRRIAERAGAMTGALTGAIARRVDVGRMRAPVALFNTLSWDRGDPVALPDGSWMTGVNVPAGGWTVVDTAAALVSEQAVGVNVSADGRQLANGYWKLRLDERGHVAELYDLINDRPVVPEGRVGNVWQVFEDRPLRFDAWDIDLFYEQSPLDPPVLTSVDLAESGPARAAVELTWRLPHHGPDNAPGDEAETIPPTVIRQRIAMYAGHPRIDFETTIDWHEHHQLLKLAWPTGLRARQASYEIQFGHVTRPTHRNTAWDLARFEVCAHRWVDLSEHGYGLALLNDCKYGHDIHDGVIRLTCLKSPQGPAAMADRGRHTFTYALMPHAGSLQEAGVIRAAAELNQPIRVQPIDPEPDDASEADLPIEHAAVACDAPAVIVETLKPSEDGKATIARLYESFGSRVKATLRFAAPPKRAELTDLLEQPLDAQAGVALEGEAVRVTLRPFQVVTLRLTW